MRILLEDGVTTLEIERKYLRAREAVAPLLPVVAVDRLGGTGETLSIYTVEEALEIGQALICEATRARMETAPIPIETDDRTAET